VIISSLLIDFTGIDVTVDNHIDRSNVYLKSFFLFSI
jgi:hypothetical protein